MPPLTALDRVPDILELISEASSAAARAAIELQTGLSFPVHNTPHGIASIIHERKCVHFLQIPNAPSYANSLRGHIAWSRASGFTFAGWC